MGGATSGEGRVEICNDNHYGSVCNDKWGHEEAEVVCGQLGFQRKGIYISGYYILIAVHIHAHVLSKN